MSEDLPEGWHRHDYSEKHHDEWYKVYRYKNKTPGVVVYKREKYDDWIVKKACNRPKTELSDKYGEFETKDEALKDAIKLMNSLEFEKEQGNPRKRAIGWITALIGLFLMLTGRPVAILPLGFALYYITKHMPKTEYNFKQEKNDG